MAVLHYDKHFCKKTGSISKFTYGKHSCHLFYNHRSLFFPPFRHRSVHMFITLRSLCLLKAFMLLCCIPLRSPFCCSSAYFSYHHSACFLHVFKASICVPSYGNQRCHRLSITLRTRFLSHLLIALLTPFPWLFDLFSYYHPSCFLDFFRTFICAPNYGKHSCHLLVSPLLQLSHHPLISFTIITVRTFFFLIMIRSRAPLRETP